MSTDLFGTVKVPFGYDGLQLPGAGAQVDDSLLRGVQARVNGVAEARLAMRRLIDTAYSRESLPVGVTVDSAGRSAGVHSCTVDVKPCRLLTATFCVDLPAAALLARNAAGAHLEDLVARTGEMAAAEDEAILDSLIRAAGTSRVSADWKVAVSALRGAGHSGALAAAISGADEVEMRLDKDTWRAVQGLFSGGIVGTKLPAGVTAVIFDPAPQHVHLVVGQNYTVTPVAFDGLSHTFALTTSFRVLVTSPDAIRVVKSG